RGLSLGTRIFLGTALELALSLGVAVAVVSVLGERVSARAARDRILGSAALIAAEQQQRFDQLQLLAEVLAGSPTFKAYLAEAILAGDRFSILDQLDERRSELRFD